MELRTYFAIMRRYWQPLVIIPLVAALVGLAATYAISPRYISVATVQLIPDGAEPRTLTVRNQEGASNLVLGLRDPTELLSQGVIESLGSREVVGAVVDDLELDRSPPPQGFAAFKARLVALVYDAWALIRFGYVARTDERAGAMAAVERALRGELVRGSYFMRISATWSNPETAAELANSAVAAVERHAGAVASRAASEQRQFLEGQVQEARQQVEGARAALEQYSAQHGVAPGESLQAAVRALEETRRDLGLSSAALADAGEQLRAARGQLEALPAEVVSQQETRGQATSRAQETATVQSPNPVFQSLEATIGTLRQDIASMEERRDRELAQLRDQIDAQLTEARARRASIEKELAKKGHSSLVRDTLKDRAFTVGEEIAALEARRAADEAALRARQDLDLADARRRLEVAEQQQAGLPPTLETRQVAEGSGDGEPVRQRTVAPNPVYQEAQERLLVLEQQAAAAQARQGLLAGMLAEREQQLRAATAHESRLAALSRELALANDLYSRRVAQLADARVEETRPVSPLRVIDPAAPPIYPVQPIKYLWTLIAAAGGAVAAVGLVFVRHSTDVAVRSPREVQALTDLPLLAVVETPRGRLALPEPARQGKVDPE